nr:polycystic kidney disease protein 1-like 3 isoform X2 [Oryctolagus cuniculus]
MFSLGRGWLWLCIRTAVLLGNPLNAPGQQGKRHCYQLHRLQYSLPEAEKHCHDRGGHLLNPWNQAVQGFIQKSLEEGTTWWIGQKRRLERKHSDVISQLPHFSCTLVSRNAGQTTTQEDSCSNKHFFICQTAQDAIYKRNENNSNPQTRPMPQRNEKASGRVADSERERQRERSSSHWFTPQKATTAGAAPIRSQKKPSVSPQSPMQLQGPKHLGHPLLPSRATAESWPGRGATWTRTWHSHGMPASQAEDQPRATRHSFLCHSSVPIPGPLNLCQPVSSCPLTEVTPLVTKATSAPPSPSLPGISELTLPAAATHAAGSVVSELTWPAAATRAAGSVVSELTLPAAATRAAGSVVSELTWPAAATRAGTSAAGSPPRPAQDAQPGALTTLPQASPWTTADQTTDETAGNLRGVTDDVQAHRELQRACKVLQELSGFTSRLSTPAQVNAINSLISLSEQLLQMPFQNSSLAFRMPVTSCLTDPLSNVLSTTEESWQRPTGGPEQVEDVLEMALVALGRIHEAGVQQNPASGSSVTLSSALAVTMLSSRNASTLPLSSYTLGHPAPVSLGFPSAAALEELLSKHPGVNVQVAGLAFNPFKDFDNRDIVGSIGTVLLSSNLESLQVHDLMEDIEIVLWRSESLDPAQPSSLSLSTEQLVITLNITSSEESLILSVQPDIRLPVTLYLAFQHQPEPADCHLNITLPKDQVWQKDEEYTWVLTPESLRYGIGTYYVTAVLNGDAERPALVSVVTAVTQCYFWDSHNRTWRSDGCQVGPRSTVSRTQCLCNHLTFFGSDFFILPRTVNVKDTIRLLLRVTSNPVGVSLLASLLGCYVVLAAWAWRKDRADTQKVKVSVLADNDPSCQFHYLVQVYTGYRRRAATTAKVVITLYGSEGRSEPHHLCDPQKAVFERGALDVFLLTTKHPLGELHSLRLWHDNSGVSPSWYVNQVVVSDMTVKKKWHFLCNCWLAVDLGDCQRDRIFLPASQRELLSFRHLFSCMIVENFTQDYLWLSVATRHPWNRFTRVQRLSCCATLLLCNMLINVMFWKAGGSAGRRAPVGLLAVTWSELHVSIQTAVILFPINLVIARLFPAAQPPETQPPFPPTQASSLSDAPVAPLSRAKVLEELQETVGFLLRRRSCLLSECEQPSGSSCDLGQLVKLLCSLVCAHIEEGGCRQQPGPPRVRVAPESQRHLCCYLLGVARRLESDLGALSLSPVPHPWDFADAASRLHELQELLQTCVLPTEQEPSREVTCFPLLSPGEWRKPLANGWHRWLPFTCWILLGAISLASAFFTALYSLDLNTDQATSWLVSMVLSVLQNIFISQPIKVVVLTFMLSLLMKRIPWLSREREQQTRRILALAAKCSPSPPGSRDQNNPIYRAPATHSAAAPPAGAVKGKKLFKLTGDIVVQILFLGLLLSTVYSGKNSNRFHLHQAVRKSFSHRFSEIKLLEDFYPWARHSLLPNLYGNYTGFITDGNCFLLGTVLLRQIRAAFPAAASAQEQGTPPQQPWEGTGNCGLHWGTPNANITTPEAMWHHQDEEAQRGSPIQGEFAAYSEGGCVVRLGKNSSTAARVLQHLEQQRWLDRCTKVLSVEFVVFNANVNLFCVVTLTLESSDVGTLIGSVRVGSLPSPQTLEGLGWAVISQVVYHLLVCYYAFVQGRRLRQQGWRFLTHKRNALDTSVVLVSFVILVLDLRQIFLHRTYMAQRRQDRDRFINFHEAVQVDSAVTHLVGILVLLATVQLWNLLHHDARLQVISRTLSRAWDEVTGFLLIILLLLTGYATVFHVLFGWKISDYRTFVNSVVTVVGLLMGISHYKEVIALDPVLGCFLILASAILMVLVVINLFVSAILMAFGKERKSLKTETTLLDMLLQKLSSLLGIRWHQNPSPEKQP